MDQVGTKEEIVGPGRRLLNVPMRACDAWVRTVSVGVTTTAHVTAILELDFVVFDLDQIQEVVERGSF